MQTHTYTDTWTHTLLLFLSPVAAAVTSYTSDAYTKAMRVTMSHHLPQTSNIQAPSHHSVRPSITIILCDSNSQPSPGTNNIASLMRWSCHLLFFPEPPLLNKLRNYLKGRKTSVVLAGSVECTREPTALRLSLTTP